MLTAYIPVDFCCQRNRFDATFLPRFRSHLRRHELPISCIGGAHRSATSRRMHGYVFCAGNLPLANSVAKTAFGTSSPLAARAHGKMSPIHRQRSPYCVEIASRCRGSPLNVTILPPGVGRRNSEPQHTSLATRGAGRTTKHTIRVSPGRSLHDKMRFKDLIWALDLLRVIHADIHLDHRR